jgi:hypothetical protein
MFHHLFHTYHASIKQVKTIGQIKIFTQIPHIFEVEEEGNQFLVQLALQIVNICAF